MVLLVVVDDDAYSSSPPRVYSVSCERCNSVFMAVYHLALVHANTFTLGYLELAK